MEMHLSMREDIWLRPEAVTVHGEVRDETDNIVLRAEKLGGTNAASIRRGWRR